MSKPIRHAMCNEPFERTPFEEVCRTLRTSGYEGIEISPFTLSPDPLDISPMARREYSRIMRSEGLEFVGLHWLMVSPPGLHVTTPDAALRERSWLHIRNLIDLCSDLRADPADPAVMIFGSPKQRSTTGGLTPAEATRHYVDGLAAVAPQAEQRGVTILVEALPAAQSDVVLTLDEAAAIVHEIGSPAIQTMFDTHNAVDEVEPHTALIEKHCSVIKHVHVNEMDGRYPGTGDYDFAAVLRKLESLDYAGWVSLEVFDFKPDARTIAESSLSYLKGSLAKNA
jgi:sugar phosphate isomerase/epimerase